VSSKTAQTKSYKVYRVRRSQTTASYQI